MNRPGGHDGARRAAGGWPGRAVPFGPLALTVLGLGCAIGQDWKNVDGGATTITWTTGGSGTTATGGGGTGGGGTGGTGGGGGTTTSTGTGGAYRHTIAIDGNNDFVVGDERFDTTTGGSFYGYYAWDETHLYVGAQGTDVAGGQGANAKWLQIYIGGSPGTKTGAKYGLGSVAMQPTLPFEARYHVQWRMDNGASLASEYKGASWSFVSFSGDVFQKDTYVELRIPLADLGSPATIDVHLAMINERDGGEWTWSGVPSSSFKDGKDPDYAHYYSFDLSGAGKPTSYSPK